MTKCPAMSINVWTTRSAKLLQQQHGHSVENPNSNCIIERKDINLMLSTGLKRREMSCARKSLMWHSCQHRCSCIADSHFDNSAINLVNLQDQMMWM